MPSVCFVCRDADNPTQHSCPTCRRPVHVLCGRSITGDELDGNATYRDDDVWCSECDPTKADEQQDDEHEHSDCENAPVARRKKRKREQHIDDELNPLQVGVIYVIRHAWKQKAVEIQNRLPLVGELVRLRTGGDNDKGLLGQVTKLHSKGAHKGTCRVDCPPAERCQEATGEDLGKPVFLLVDEATEDAPFRQAKCGLLHSVDEATQRATIDVAGGKGRHTGPVANVRIQPVVYPYVQQGQLHRAPLPLPQEYSDLIIERCGLLGGHAGREELKRRCDAMHADLVRSSQLRALPGGGTSQVGFPLLFRPW